MDKNKILIVDNDDSCLPDIEQIEQYSNRQWEVIVENSCADALLRSDLDSFSVVLAEIKMPEMDGIEFLEEIQKRDSGTIRFATTLNPKSDDLLRASNLAHRFIAKPCQVEKLTSMLNSSLGIRELLSNQEIHSKIVGISSLPSPPAIYNRLINEINSDLASIGSIADIVKEDISLTAKLLQMINSSFFGLATHVESPTHAINLLGLNTLKGLIVSASIFSQFKDSKFEGISIDSIYRNSMAVSNLAMKIAKEIGLSRSQIDDALIAGMLHDIGKLVLITSFPEEFKKAINLSRRDSIPLHQAEKSVMNLTHADIGAHLLSLWCLPDTILEAVLLHMNPQRFPIAELGVLSAVHIAAGIESESILDLDYLNNLNLTDKLPIFKELSTEMAVD